MPLIMLILASLALVSIVLANMTVKRSWSHMNHVHTGKEPRTKEKEKGKKIVVETKII